MDGSHPRYEAQIAAVEGILRDLEYLEIPRMLVFTKADLLGEEGRNALLDGRVATLISAMTGEGIDAFLRAVDDRLPVRARPTSAV